MARTKQTAGRSTGASAPRKPLAAKSLITGSRVSPASAVNNQINKTKTQRAAGPEPEATTKRSTRTKTRNTAAEPEAEPRHEAEAARTKRRPTKTKTPKTAAEPEPEPSLPPSTDVSQNQLCRCICDESKANPHFHSGATFAPMAGPSFTATNVIKPFVTQ